MDVTLHGLCSEYVFAYCDHPLMTILLTLSFSKLCLLISVVNGELRCLCYGHDDILASHLVYYNYG